MNQRRKRQRRKRRKQIVAALVIAVIAVVGFSVAWIAEEAGHTQERGVMQEGVGQRKRVEYNGTIYEERTGLTNLLLMGIDREDGSWSYGARQGGQADFLMLVVIDHEAKTISRLQIDRDTMTPVKTVGVLGNDTGFLTMQICLSHGYGADEKARCLNACAAVETLLQEVEIDGYIAMNLDAIGLFNDALGGVTVTVQDDFSSYDPQMVPGATLKLTGEQAETFVRSRMNVGDGTNEARMARQNAYMTAAVEVLQARMGEDASFVGTLLDRMGDSVTSSMSRGQLLNEANRAYHYEILPTTRLDGTYEIGSDGFMEFHVSDGATHDWVMQTLFAPQENAAELEGSDVQ